MPSEAHDLHEKSPAVRSSPSSSSSSSSSSIAKIPAGCYALSDTHSCRAFSGYFIPSTFTYGNVSAGNPIAFDLMMQQLLTSDQATSQMRQAFSCSNWSPDLAARYSLTIKCRQILDEAMQNATTKSSSRLNSLFPDPSTEASSGPDIMDCNSPSDKLVRLPVCRDTCNAYVSSWEGILGNDTICPDSHDPDTPSNIPTILSSLTSMCASNTFNGTNISGFGCISGSDNEPGSCGFSLDQKGHAQCTYCSGHWDDPCCKVLTDPVSGANSSCSLDQSLSNPSSSRPGKDGASVAAIVSGSVGGVLGVVLAALALLYYRRARNERLKSKEEHHALRASMAMVGLKGGTTTLSTEEGVTSSSRPMGPIPVAASISTGSRLEGLWRVVHSYTPLMPDELGLQVGDWVDVIQVFDDGWAVGRIGGQGTSRSRLGGTGAEGGDAHGMVVEGVFPMACVARSPSSPQQPSSACSSYAPSVEEGPETGSTSALPLTSSIPTTSVPPTAIIPTPALPASSALPASAIPRRGSSRKRNSQIPAPPPLPNEDDRNPGA
ncbi:MAG: hypothetical protein DHS80DRAFT_23887 [Piptocephalis tieghemiana]|nr:MAG: hypothetical protein DHS80DRAFT_23887 [Piptocephalis tieghemiana]